MAQFRAGVVPFARKSSRAPVRLRVADLVALAIAGGCALQATSKLMPSPSPFLQSALVIALTSLAARRLVAWRHGSGRPLKARSVPEVIAIFAGMTPWFVLPLLRPSVTGAAVATGAPFGFVLSVVGLCFILAGVLGPFYRGVRRGRQPAHDATRSAVDDCTHAAGVVLLSANPFLGALAVGSLALKWRWHYDALPSETSSLDEQEAAA